MPDIHVTTVDGLKTALQTSGANVVLDNDLDFNGVTMSSAVWCNVSCTDFDGQGHNIYNIQSGSSGTIFKGVSGNTAHIHNCNFLNCLLLGTGVLFDGYNSSNKSIAISECKIQGKFYKLSGGNLNTALNGASFVKCNFNINADAIINADNYMYCYFKFDSSSSNTPTGAITATDSYFEGHLKLQSGYYTSLSSNHNVFNIYNDNETTPTIQTVSGGAQLYNSDRATFTTSSTVYPLTDAQLKDRDYIYNNTTFPIL